MRFALGFLSAAFALVAAIPLGAQVPQVFEPQVERHEGPPLWISAKAIADKEKGLNLDLLDSDFLRSVVEKERLALGMTEKNAASEAPIISNVPFSECVRTLDIQDSGESGPVDATVPAHAKAKLILRGRIRAVDPGFSRAIPSTLLQVDLTEVIKGRNPSPVFYIDYLVAHFKIGSIRFCNTNQGFEPHPGDEILLFYFTGGPYDRNHLLYAPRVDQVFFERPGGGLFLPPRIKNAADFKEVHTLDDLVARLRSEIHSGGLETRP